jgi:uncharacterized membrane protein YbhN (UPF0104 family)
MIFPLRMPSDKVKKAAKLLLKLLVTALCIWFISHKIDIKKIAGILTVASPQWVLLAVSAFMFSKLLSCFRLNIYFRHIDIRLPEWKNIQLYWLGMFYNIFLPGSISGDAYKVVRLTQLYQVPYKRTTAAVLLDRFSGLLALGVLLGVCWMLAFKGGNYSYWVMSGMLLAIPFCLLLVKLFFPYFVRSFFPTFAWGMAVQVFQVVCMYCILQALHIHDHTEQYMLVFLIAAVVAVLPVSIGGLGAREVVFLWGAQVFGLDNTVSVMASVLFYCTTIVSSLPGLPLVFIDPFKPTTAQQTATEDAITRE